MSMICTTGMAMVMYFGGSVVHCAEQMHALLQRMGTSEVKFTVLLLAASSGNVTRLLHTVHAVSRNFFRSHLILGVVHQAAKRKNATNGRL